MTFSRFRHVCLQRNAIILEKDYSSDGPILGFPGELKQVFLNLIGNAIQAMPEGGRLRIRVRDALDKEHAAARRSGFDLRHRFGHSPRRLEAAIRAVLYHQIDQGHRA